MQNIFGLSQTVKVSSICQQFPVGVCSKELPVTCAEVSHLQADCGVKCDEIDNSTRETDKLTRVHDVNTFN